MDDAKKDVYDTNVDRWVDEGLEGTWVLIKETEPFIFPTYEDALNFETSVVPPFIKEIKK